MSPVDPVPDPGPIVVTPSWGDRLKDVAERVVVTFVIVFAGAAIASGVADISDIQAAAIAGVAAALVVLKEAFMVFADVTNGSSLVQDIALRVFFTYFQTFLGFVVVHGEVNYHDAKAALVAAVPAALSVIKGVAAAYLLKHPNTASLLPASVPVMPPTDALAGV